MVDFTAQVNAWARKSERRLEAVFKESVQDLVEEAQTPIAKGGRLPVDTSFLRNSGQAAINSLPSGTSTPANFAATTLTINRASIGDRIVFGWTANYAPFMEARYAFMRSAAQNWQGIVFRAANRVQRTVES